MLNCPKCAAELPDTSRFCPACGAVQPGATVLSDDAAGNLNSALADFRQSC